MRINKQPDIVDYWHFKLKNSARSNDQIIKYQSFTRLGCKDKNFGFTKNKALLVITYTWINQLSL